jgi:hypothetical protein
MSNATLEQKIEALRELLAEIVDHPDYMDSPYRLMAVLSEGQEDETAADEDAAHDYEMYVGGDLMDAMDLVSTFVQNLLEESESEEETSLIVGAMLHTLQEHVSSGEEE